MKRNILLVALALALAACAHLKPERECSKVCRDFKSPWPSVAIPPPAWDECMNNCLAEDD